MTRDPLYNIECLTAPPYTKYLTPSNPEHHEYELYLAIEDIDHTRTKARSPQTNGICERFHKTVLDEFYRIAFRKRIYATIEQLQGDLDAWMSEYNQARPSSRPLVLRQNPDADLP